MAAPTAAAAAAQQHAGEVAAAPAPASAAAAAATAPPRPRVGMGVFVVNEHGQFCLGRRLNSLGHGEWALPGGHLEHGEALEECAAREVLEETGLELSDIRLVAVENVVFPAGAHYVVLFMAGAAPPGSAPRVLEPTKCAEWRWLAWDAFPPADEIFQPLRQLRARGWQPPGAGPA